MSSRNYLPPADRNEKTTDVGASVTVTEAGVAGRDKHFDGAMVKAVEASATFTITQGGVELFTDLPVDAGQTVVVGPGFKLPSGDGADLVLNVTGGGASCRGTLFWFEAPAD